jgi:hypothetical protein
MPMLFAKRMQLPWGTLCHLGLCLNAGPWQFALTMCFSRYLFPETGFEGDGTRLVSDQETGGDKTRKHAGAGQAQG